MKEKGFNLTTVILIIFITSIVSAFTTGIILNNNYKGRSGFTYTEVMNDEELSEFLSVYSTIISQYYEQTDTTGMIDSAIEAMKNYDGNSKSELLELATTAMLEHLGDEYTTLMSPEENEEFMDRLSGTYEGVGITIQGKTVVTVKEGSPAHESGVKSGDIIEEVNGTIITDDLVPIIGNLIKDEESSKVTIVVSRDDEKLTFEMNREQIEISLNASVIENTNTGYIMLDIFSENVGNIFESALKDLEKQNIDNLIIDLRYNTGGYLNGAEDIASLFLDEGKVIYSTQDQDEKETIKDETKTSRDYDVVILMNSESASASEILAAALQESYGAKLVGTVSYGKGKIQKTISAGDGTLAKYTSAEWLTPSGENIDGIGLSPDYFVELEYIKDEDGNIIEVKDTQLEKAIEVINE